MSRRVCRAPVALTSDGMLLINLAVFDVPKRLDVLLAAALRERGEVFIGVPARTEEVAFIVEKAFEATYEAAAISAGRRRKRRRR